MYTGRLADVHDLPVTVKDHDDGKKIMMMDISSLKDDVDDHRVDDYNLLVPGQNKNEAVEGLEKVGAQLTRLQHLRNIKVQQIPENL